MGAQLCWNGQLQVFFLVHLLYRCSLRLYFRDLGSPLPADVGRQSTFTFYLYP